MKDIIVLETRSLKKVEERIRTLEDGEIIKYENPEDGLVTFFSNENLEKEEKNIG